MEHLSVLQCNLSGPLFSSDFMFFFFFFAWFYNQTAKGGKHLFATMAQSIIADRDVKLADAI